MVWAESATEETNKRMMDKKGVTCIFVFIKFVSDCRTFGKLTDRVTQAKA